MDNNSLILKYGRVPFMPAGTDELGTYMLIDDYKIYVRRDDLSFVVGVPVDEMYPLISRLSKP